MEKYFSVFRPGPIQGGPLGQGEHFKRHNDGIPPHPAQDVPALRRFLGHFDGWGPLVRPPPGAGANSPKLARPGQKSQNGYISS